MDDKVVGAKSENKRASDLGKQAQALLRKGQSSQEFQTAAQLFSEAIGLKPRAALYFGRGKCFLQLLQFHRAMFDFSMSIKIEPSAKHFGSRGWCFRKLGRLNEALKDYTDALRLEKDNPTFSFERGIVFFELGEHREAQEEFDHALEISGLSPGNCARAFYYRGISFRKLGNLEKSVEMLKRALTMEDDAETQNNLGLTYVDMNNYEEAKKRFTKALDFAQEGQEADPRYLNNRGLASYHLGQIDQALEDFTEALNMGEDASVSFNRGNAYYSRNEFELALTDYEQAVRLSPSCLHYHHVGLAYQGLKDIDQAIIFYQRAIAVPGETYVPSLLHLGIMYHLDGQYQKAVDIFNHPALPEHETLLERRGLVYREMGRYNNSLADFNRAIELREEADCAKSVFEQNKASALNAAEAGDGTEDGGNGGDGENKKDDDAASITPTSSQNGDDTSKMKNEEPKSSLGEYYYYRGNVNLRKGDYSMAITDLDKAMELGLSNACNCMNDRGLAYRALGNLPQACNDLTKACEQSQSPEVWCNRAQCWFEQGLYDRADADLCKALSYDDTDPQIFYKRGITRYGNRDYAAAVEDLQKSLELDVYSTTVPDIYYHLGISYANLDKHQFAVMAFDEALGRCPDRIHTIHERAKSLQIVGDHEEAVRDFTTVLEKQPTNARALFRRGFSYKALKCYDEAAEDFEAAKEFDPNDTRLVLNYRKLFSVQVVTLGVAGLEDPDVWIEEKNYDYGKLKQRDTRLKKQPTFKAS